MGARRSEAFRIALLLLLGCAVAIVYAVDPSQHALTPPCIVRLVTGLACPGCGLTRASHALLHGDVARAFAFNPLLFVAAPVAMVFTGIQFADRDLDWRFRMPLFWVLLLMALGFTVWRNTSGYPLIRV